jgi:putative tricarboxylic transport membrane protein
MIAAEKVCSLLFTAFALFVGYESLQYPLGALDNPGPGFLPLLAAAAMTVLALAYAAKAWTKGGGAARRPFWPDRQGLIKVALAFASILLFTALLEITGYMVNTFFLFLVLLRPIGQQKWRWSVALSLGATVVAYLLFDRWLMIPLPRGIGFGGG